MKSTLLIAVLLLGSSLFGQNAKVIALSESDVAEGQRLAVELASAQKHMDDYRKKISKVYLTVKEGSHDQGSCSSMFSGFVGTASSADAIMFSTTSTGTVAWTSPTPEQEAKAKAERKKWREEHPTYYFRAGWGCGEYDFTDDYRYIVPVVTPQSPPTPRWYPNGNLVYSTPQ